MFLAHTVLNNGTVRRKETHTHMSPHQFQGTNTYAVLKYAKTTRAHT
jgi:hypothetical protein